MSALGVDGARWARLRLAAALGRAGFARWPAITLMTLALASAFATYAAIAGLPPFDADPRAGAWWRNLDFVLELDLVIAVLLALLIAQRIWELWRRRRQGIAGARLHGRMVLLFGAVAITPTLIVALFSALFIDIGIQTWFNTLVRTQVDSSRLIAETYVHEHEQSTRADALALAAELTRNQPFLPETEARLETALEAEIRLRSIDGALVFDTHGHVLARAGLSLGLEFDPVPMTTLTEARRGSVGMTTSERADQVRALVQLDTQKSVFLYVGRGVDPRIVGYVEETRRANDTYHALDTQHSSIEITFSKIFGMLALLLLLTAAWVGLGVASRLVKPIVALIDAAERVRGGDLTAHVDASAGADELVSLARAFNRMTEQLAAQRTDLVAANTQLDLRRRFTETVLAGVSAGVVGLDRMGRINLPNRSASVLLGIEFDDRVGRRLADIVPEMSGLLNAATRRRERRVEAQIRLVREHRTLTLLTRVTVEQLEGETLGFVVTFDDVTELLAAQRTAAWADVARRIAHEIKNPLTPIQLSAERLKRKYLKEIRSDPETFISCTDTIVRQVGDIGRMVDEFSAFARMPAPSLKLEDLSLLCQESVSLMRNAHANVAFAVTASDDALPVRCDARQIRQVLINLLQNALDAIDGRKAGDGAAPAGRIEVALSHGAAGAVIQISDNGKGLPVDGRERLTEPYVTTRVKGTGLGLAIVKKIMEDHAGDLALDDAPGGGARVTLTLPDAGPALRETDRDFVIRTVGAHGA